MFIRTYRRQTLLELGRLLALAGLAALLLCRPQALATGISRGLAVCGQVIIPSLYPFMILAGLLTDSPLCRRPGRLVGRFTRTVFGLPGCCAPVILLGLVGGYPAGALAIGGLLRQDCITREEARRMTRFCINAGPGFIISTVGCGLLGSSFAGWLLFAAHAAASLCIGVCLGQGHRQPRPERPLTDTPPRSLAQVVSDTCGGLLSLCGFVLLAAAGLSLLDSGSLLPILSRLLRLPAAILSRLAAGITEVSCGCMALAGQESMTPFWLGMCLGWGGLSVHGQVWAGLRGQLSPDGGFFLGRLLHGVLGGCLSLLLFRLIPSPGRAADAMAVGDTALPFSVTCTASLALLGFTFLAMLCFSPKNTGKNPADMVHC